MAFAGAIAMASTIGVGCAPTFGTVDTPVRYQVLTSESTSHYAFTGDGSSVVATADAAFSDDNVRELFWQFDAPWAADQQTCLTWNNPVDVTKQEPVQPGVALRIAPTGGLSDGVKAITVTDNVLYGAVWIFNVHVWDTSNHAHPFRQLAGFDLSPIVGKIWVDHAGIRHSTLKPQPWHVCALAFGNQFWFKVWTLGNPEPSWTDPARVFKTLVPDGWTGPGYAGGYIGHLRSGDSVTYTGQTYAKLCQNRDLWGTYACISRTGHLNHDSNGSTSR